MLKKDVQLALELIENALSAPVDTHIKMYHGIQARYVLTQYAAGVLQL